MHTSTEQTKTPEQPSAARAPVRNRAQLGKSRDMSSLPRSATTAITRLGHELASIPVYPRSSVATSPAGSTDQQIECRLPFRQEIDHSFEEEEAAEEAIGPVEPISVGEVTIPDEIAPSNLDSISSTISHVSSVSRGGAAFGGFGVTNSSVSLSNVVITHSATTFTVTGDFVQTITWEVRSGTGPSSQKDISGLNDPDITAGNYPTVASDLTPNMSSDNGRPPRTMFWAEDLTEKHELFHTTQRSGPFGNDTATAIKNWLDGQTAISEAGIRSTLLPQALAEGVRVFNAFVAAPTTEGDAYGDGAPLYRARADAITAKGDGGGY